MFSILFALLQDVHLLSIDDEEEEEEEDEEEEEIRKEEFKEEENHLSNGAALEMSPLMEDTDDEHPLDLLMN